MPPSGFSRSTGVALVAGGVLTLLVNLGLSPFLEPGAPLTRTAATPLFAWRQGFSALAAASLLFGSIGLYPRQAERAGWFGGAAFAAAFFGSASLLAWEWVDFFILRELAFRAPAALETLESIRGVSLYSLGALIPFGLFSLGWIALAASTIRTRRDLRSAAVLLIAGFFAGPLASAALGPKWGGILGSAVLGLGWMGLGWGVRRAAGDESDGAATTPVGG